MDTPYQKLTDVYERLRWKCASSLLFQNFSRQNEFRKLYCLPEYKVQRPGKVLDLGQCGVGVLGCVIYKSSIVSLIIWQQGSAHCSLLGPHFWSLSVDNYEKHGKVFLLSLVSMASDYSIWRICSQGYRIWGLNINYITPWNQNQIKEVVWIE